MKFPNESKLFNNGKESSNNNDKSDTNKEEKKVEIITPVASNPRSKEYREEMIDARKESKKIEGINKRYKEGGLLSQTELSEIGKLDIENFGQKKVYGENITEEENKEEERASIKKSEKMQEETEEDSTKKETEEENKEESESKENIFKQILDKNRKKFVSRHLESGNKIEIFNNPEIEDAKIEYTKALQDYRKDALEKSKEELKKQNLTEEEYEKQLKKETERILTETVVVESNKIYDLKTEIRLEKKGGSKIEEIKKITLKVVDGYRKLGWKKKLLISAGLFGASMAVGAASGATGTAIMTGVLFGKFTQRTLGGAGLGVAIEALMKKRQEKKEVKEMLSGFGLDMTKLLEEGDKKLDKKISELVGKKNAQKWKRLATAGATGAFIGLGGIGYAIEHTFGLGQGFLGNIKEPHNLGVNDLRAEEATNHLTGGHTYTGAHIPSAENMTSVPDEIIAKQGDSLWKISEEYLNEHGNLNGLNGPQKTYVIDSLKDKLATGMNNPDMINPGEHIGFGDKVSINDINDAIGKAHQLTSEQLVNIQNNINSANGLDVNNFHAEEANYPTGQSGENAINNPIEPYTYTAHIPSPESLNIQPVHEAISNLFHGGNTEEIVKNIFPGVFGGNEGAIIDRKDGIKVIKDAFKKGYDILISPSGKIGVDGPMGWNWGSKGSFLGLGSKRIPLEKINSDSISAAKKFIIESAKAIANQSSGNMDYR